MGQKKTAIITGSGGYIATHLIQVLRAKHPEIDLRLTSRKSNKLSAHKTFFLDMLDKKSVEENIKNSQPQIIFHLAGLNYSYDLEKLFYGNVLPTHNLLEAIKKYSPSSRVLIPGSAAEYGYVEQKFLPVNEETQLNPINPYGVSKVWQTTVAKFYMNQGLDIIIARIFNIIGPSISPKQSIGNFSSQLRKIKNKEIPPIMTIGNVKAKRDFVNIYDVCSALISLTFNGKTGNTYNVCSGQSIAIGEILQKMIKESQIHEDIIFDTQFEHKNDIPDIYGSYEKTLSHVGWRPACSLEEGIQQSVTSPSHETN